MAFCYVLKCRDNSYYIGATTNVDKRLVKHNQKLVRYTKSRLPIRLVFVKEFSSFGEARRFEKKVKSWKKRKSIEKMIEKPDNIASKFLQL